MKTTCLFLLGLAFCWGLFSCTAQQPKPEEVIEIINRVNNYWQETHPQHGRSVLHRGLRGHLQRGRHRVGLHGRLSALRLDGQPD